MMYFICLFEQSKQVVERARSHYGDEAKLLNQHVLMVNTSDSATELAQTIKIRYHEDFNSDRPFGLILGGIHRVFGYIDDTSSEWLSARLKK